MKRGVWTKGSRRIIGEWRWSASFQRFEIFLDEPDPVTGRRRYIEVSGDEPDFNDWVLDDAAKVEEPSARGPSPVEELLAALEPFADYVEKRGEAMPDNTPMDTALAPGRSPTLGDCRKAAAAIAHARAGRGS